MNDRIRFVRRRSKQILLLDLSHCSTAEVEEVFRELPEIVTARARGSLLILSDFTGAIFNEEGMRIMKETAVFDKPYVKKSAFVGGESFPEQFHEKLKRFSRREFPACGTREEALDWLVRD
ncbi:MAG: hypothetical protein WCB11_10790 [Terriglobales bacterium]